MKKLIGLIALAALTGCGSGNHGDKDSTDSLAADTAVVTNPADDAVAEVAKIYLTAHALGHPFPSGEIDSINGVMVGATLSELPDTISGVYNRKARGRNRAAKYVEFREDDTPRFIAYDFGEGNVDVINLIGSDIKVKTLKGDLAIGDRMSAVLDLPGVVAEWSDDDGRGMWYWCWEGLWFAPSQQNLSTELSHRLYHAGQAPTMRDFDDGDVRIGFIGTGLPF